MLLGPERACCGHRGASRVGERMRSQERLLQALTGQPGPPLRWGAEQTELPHNKGDECFAASPIPAMSTQHLETNAPSCAAT